MIFSRWLWSERTLGARAARVALLPLAAAYHGTMRARAAAYDRGILRRRRAALPTVAIGNLTVGGSGKTPLAQWTAARFVEWGLTPAIVLRGYGGDEGDEHREAVPAAIVAEDPDRHAAIARSAAEGATVAVLDDAFQRLDLLPDLTIAAVSAESCRAVQWPFPAGPWRERWRALQRADVIVVTRKRADRGTAQRMAGQVQEHAPNAAVACGHLHLADFRGLCSDGRTNSRQLCGARVLAVAGIADPDSFAAQLRELGATVDLWRRPDHAPYTDVETARVLQAGRSRDYVVLTAKDAVKLRGRWPADHREPLVARLEVAWEAGADRVHDALERVAAAATGVSPMADERD